MSNEMIGLLCIVIMLVLMAMKMWTGLAMAIAGFIGVYLLRGFTPAWTVMFTGSFNRIVTYAFTVMPMFILMGSVISETDIGKKLYKTMYLFLGHIRGGLAQATVGATAFFASITGTQLCSALIMSRVALPEMEKYKYDERLSTGCIAASSPIGMLIPPSNALILYGILTEVSIARLFMGGLVPGLMAIVFFIIVIAIWTHLNPKLAPAASGIEKPSLRERLSSLKYVLPILILFLVVMATIYLGIGTATEAGAVGAFGAIIIATAMRQLTFKKLLKCLHETASMLGMIMLSIMGAFIFSSALTMSRLPIVLSDIILGMPLSSSVIIAIFIFCYLILSTVIPEFPLLMMTVPIVFPVIVVLGFDPVWFGVVIATLMAVGTVTPPVGLTTFAIAGVTGKPVNIIFKGILPFVAAMVILIALLLAFPQIVLWLPNRT